MLTEGVLKIKTACYTDLFGAGSGCPSVPFIISSTRGKIFGLQEDGTNAASALSSYSEDIPYSIPEEFQWGPGKPLTKPRSPEDFLRGNTSVIREIAERWDELNSAPNYKTAMRIADEIIYSMKTGSYRGTPYTEVSLLQVAVKEGLTDEEIAFFFEANADIGGNANLRQNLDHQGAVLVRQIAMLKADLDGGPSAMVTPVDSKFRRVGMNTITEKLLDIIRNAGVKVFFDSKVISVTRTKPDSQFLSVTLQTGISITSGKVFLNVGKPDLIALGVSSEPILSSQERFRRAVERTFMEGLSKVYCFWEDAWWLTKMKIPVGRSRTQETMYSMRYHDGHVTCQNSTALTGCRGGALVSYVFGDTSGLSAAIWAHTHNNLPYSPLTNTDNVRRLIPGSMTGVEQLFLDDLVTQIRRVHKSSLETMGHDVEEAIPQPAGCILADWHDVGTHDHMGPGKGDLNLFEMFRKPVADLNVSLVNEGWGQITGWLESSFNSAERALFHVYGVPRPKWMDKTFHTAVIVNDNRGAKRNQ